MSAVFGVLQHDGRTVTPADLHRMGTQLAPRKVCDPSYWYAESTGLGHAAPVNEIRATPSGRALTASTGISRHPSGTVITVTGRIDNREELASSLRQQSSAWDGELILAAYDRYGLDCANHLIGEFAFALWDPRHSRLFCARDPFGIRPFYYCAAATYFLFGSEIGPILSCPSVSRALNEYRIAELITESVHDDEITIYEAVRRLPPGHSLTVSKGAVELRRYWRPEDAPEIRFNSDAEYVDAFRSTFQEAVRCRMDAGRTTGVTLSGGLDSSAVVGAARANLQEGAITTFSAVYPEFPPCDERPYIQSVVEKFDLESHLVQPSLYNPLAELEADRFALAEPHFWPTWCMEGPLFQAAQERGVRVLLTGHGGDHVLAKSNVGRNSDLIRTGRWTAVFREARQGAQSAGPDTMLHLWRDYLKPYLSGVAPELLLSARLRRKAANSPKLQRLNPSFIGRAGIIETWAGVAARRRRHERSARSYHAHLLNHAPTHYGLDLLDAVSARFSLRLSHPFWDRRLVEFCYCIPRDRLAQGGRTGGILRTALADLLPEPVRQRSTKAFFNPAVIYTLRKHNADLMARLMEDLDVVSRWIDTETLRSAYRRCFAEDHTAVYKHGFSASSDAGFLIAAATLILWLQRVKPPVGPDFADGGA